MVVNRSRVTQSRTKAPYGHGDISYNVRQKMTLRSDPQIGIAHAIGIVSVLTSHRKFLIQFVVILGFGFFLSACRDYDNTPRDRARLQRMCDPVRDVPSAVEAHKLAHGSYPLTMEDLDLALPKSSAAVSALKSSDGFVYSSSGDTFSIYKKLNWDGGIVFESMHSKWLYKLNEDKEIPVY